MDLGKTMIQSLGGLLCIIGVIGLFARISHNDGALAITGAIVFAAGVLSQPPAKPS